MRIALGGPGRVVRIYSTEDGSLLHEIRKHTEWIYALEFSPDGVLLATADRNGGLFVWEAETAREFQNLAGHKAAVTDVSWRDDSNVLASGSEDGTIKLWEIEGGKEIKSWAAHGNGTSAIDFAHDGRIASVGRDNLTKLWGADGAAISSLPAFSDLAMEVALTHDGARVVAGDWLGDVRMSDSADGKQVAALVPNPPTLEMLVQAQTEIVNAANAAAAKAAEELAAAQAVVAEKAKASQAAADAAAAANANLQSVVAEKAAFDQQQSAQAAVSP
jgi:WD40 repeat protein